MTGLENTLIQLGSFGLVALIVIHGVRWMPRAVHALESMKDSLERIEDKIDGTGK